MDQIKTGKLIAKLRKEKGMTQQELADIFNINYRSVSKWETGKTMPDIANIDLLSEIFGVSSDELLKGELNKKDIPKTKKYKFHKKYLLFLIPMILIIAIVAIIIYKNNESETYIISSNNKSDYYVEGEMILNNSNITVVINKVIFYNKSFYQTKIKEYKYQLFLNNKLLFAYAHSESNKNKYETMEIKDFSNMFTVNYNDEIKIDKEILTSDKLILKLFFTDEFDKQIVKDIEMNIVPKNDDYTNSTQ